MVAIYEVLSAQVDRSSYDYAVLTTRFQADRDNFEDGAIVADFGRAGATFSVIKAMTPEAEAAFEGSNCP